MMYDVWCMSYDVCSMIHGVLCNVMYDGACWFYDGILSMTFCTWPMIHDVCCMMYDEICMTNGAFCMMCGVYCLNWMYDAKWRILYDVLLTMRYVWCMLYVVGGMACHIWCMMYCVWCTMCDEVWWRMACDVWCMLYDVWCMMCCG